MGLTIDDLGYVEEMRQRLGVEHDDASRDAEILAMKPFDRVKLLSGWFLGDSAWADSFLEWCESQGIYFAE